MTEQELLSLLGVVHTTPGLVAEHMGDFLAERGYHDAAKRLRDLIDEWEQYRWRRK